MKHFAFFFVYVNINKLKVKNMEDLNYKQMLIAEEYRRKYEHCSKYDPAKGGQLLNEQLVPAKWDELKYAMEQDSELHTFLKTPAKDLPDNYKLLVSEIDEHLMGMCLHDLIALSLSRRAGNFICYFSKSGLKITGFVAYQVSNNEVVDIKMFSFDPKPTATSFVLIRDLDKLLSELITKYNKVSWGAMPQNPANAIYKKVIEHYGGKVEQDGNMIRYTIVKNMGNENQNNISI